MSHKIPRSWLEEDPEWELLRRKAEKLPVSKPLKRKIATQQSRRSGEVQPKIKHQAGIEHSEKEMVVNVKIAVPKVKIPDARELYAKHKSAIHKTSGVLAVLVVLAVSPMLISAFSSKDNPEVKGTSAQNQATFTPFVPVESKTGVNEKPKLDITFDEYKKVLGYSTEYNGAVMTVSQQQLPDKVKNSPGELGYIAKSIRAENQIQTQNGLAYIADDIKSKTQTVLFSKDNVLIFINANAMLDNSEWEFFINQLVPNQ